MSIIRSESINREISTLYYLGYFSPDQSSQDNTSIALMHFNEGTIEYVNTWVSILIKSFSKKYDYIIRNLRPHELSSLNENQYDYICNVLAWNIKSQYYFDLISKDPSIVKSTKKERNTVTNSLLSLNISKSLNDLKPNNILIFDDIYSNENSLTTLTQLIKENFPKVTVDILVLCKTSLDHLSDINSDLNQEFNFKISYDAPYNTPKGFKNKGFFNHSTFFPQKWQGQFEELFYWGDNHHYIRISLEVSKESYLVPYGNFILVLGHTPFIKESGNHYVIDKNTLLGSYSGRLYFLPIAYKDQYFPEVQMGSFKYLSEFDF